MLSAAQPHHWSDSDQPRKVDRPNAIALDQHQEPQKDKRSPTNIKTNPNFTPGHHSMGTGQTLGPARGTRSSSQERPAANGQTLGLPPALRRHRSLVVLGTHRPYKSRSASGTSTPDSLLSDNEVYMPAVKGQGLMKLGHGQGRSKRSVSLDVLRQSHECLKLGGSLNCKCSLRLYSGSAEVIDKTSHHNNTRPKVITAHQSQHPSRKIDPKLLIKPALLTPRVKTITDLTTTTTTTTVQKTETPRKHDHRKAAFFAGIGQFKRVDPDGNHRNQAPDKPTRDRSLSKDPDALSDQEVSSFFKPSPTVWKTPVLSSLDRKKFARDAQQPDVIKALSAETEPPSYDSLMKGTRRDLEPSVGQGQSECDKEVDMICSGKSGQSLTSVPATSKESGKVSEDPISDDVTVAAKVRENNQKQKRDRSTSPKGILGNSKPAKDNSVAFAKNVVYISKEPGKALNIHRVPDRNPGLSDGNPQDKKPIKPKTPLARRYVDQPPFNDNSPDDDVVSSDSNKQTNADVTHQHKDGDVTIQKTNGDVMMKQDTGGKRNGDVTFKQDTGGKRNGDVTFKQDTGGKRNGDVTTKQKRGSLKTKQKTGDVTVKRTNGDVTHVGYTYQSTEDKARVISLLNRYAAPGRSILGMNNKDMDNYLNSTKRQLGLIPADETNENSKPKPRKSANETKEPDMTPVSKNGAVGVKQSKEQKIIPETSAIVHQKRHSPSECSRRETLNGADEDHVIILPQTTFHVDGAITESPTFRKRTTISRGRSDDENNNADISQQRAPRDSPRIHRKALENGDVIYSRVLHGYSALRNSAPSLVDGGQLPAEMLLVVPEDRLQAVLPAIHDSIRCKLFCDSLDTWLSSCYLTVAFMLLWLLGWCLGLCSGRVTPMLGAGLFFVVAVLVLLGAASLLHFSRKKLSYRWRGSQLVINRLLQQHKVIFAFTKAAGSITIYFVHFDATSCETSLVKSMRGNRADDKLLTQVSRRFPDLTRILSSDVRCAQNSSSDDEAKKVIARTLVHHFASSCIHDFLTKKSGNHPGMRRNSFHWRHNRLCICDFIRHTLEQPLVTSEQPLVTSEHPLTSQAASNGTTLLLIKPVKISGRTSSRPTLL